MSIDNRSQPMQKYFHMILVALMSSLISFFIFRYLDGSEKATQWEGRAELGSARYTGLVDKLLDARSAAAFHSSSPTNFIDAAAMSTPAVVNIRAIQETEPGFWGKGGSTGSSGSGVLISPDGYIVTNHHVVEKSSEIKVTLADKRSYIAKLVGSDPSTDIALLKLSGTDFPFMVFGNSDSLLVGEWVLAVGNPFNLESTVTAGIVSAKGRNINILGGGASIEAFIQTDAAVNPGNSGGALVNTAGELIGINTAIITESGSYEGYSFAIPCNLVQKVIRDIREFGMVQRAFLGVGIQDLDNETALNTGLPNAQGVYVNRISVNSAAEAAGLKVGDVIVGINQIEIRSTPELQEYVGRYRPGDKIKVTFWRDGSQRNTQLVLRDGKNTTTMAHSEDNGLRDELGIELREMTREEHRKLGMNGAMVGSVMKGSVVYNTNMQPGFLIVTVNGSRVRNVAEANEAIKSAFNSVILDGYYEGESEVYSYRFRKREN